MSSKPTTTKVVIPSELKPIYAALGRQWSQAMEAEPFVGPEAWAADPSATSMWPNLNSQWGSVGDWVPPTDVNGYSSNANWVPPVTGGTPGATGYKGTSGNAGSSGYKGTSGSATDNGGGSTDNSGGTLFNFPGPTRSGGNRRDRGAGRVTNGVPTRRIGW